VYVRERGSEVLYGIWEKASDQVGLLSIFLFKSYYSQPVSVLNERVLFFSLVSAAVILRKRKNQQSDLTSSDKEEESSVT
jgi:hypothetical protein